MIRHWTLNDVKARLARIELWRIHQSSTTSHLHVKVDELRGGLSYLQARVERLEDNAPIHIVGNTEDAQRAIASLVSQLDDANAHIRRLTAQENAA